MTFLVDNQLPRALARFFNEHGHNAQHVLDKNMDEADDQAIWDYARRSNCVIVTKDEGFLGLSLRNAGGNQVIWVCLGNGRKRALLAAF